MLQGAQKGQPTKYASGWFNHTRSTCDWRKQGLLQEDHIMSAMSDRELRDHLVELGLFGPEEKKRAEENAKKVLRAQSSGAGEVRSVSVSEEPDRKKQTKEKKEEEKRKKEEDEKKRKEEDERTKKELDELNERLRAQSDVALYGYLFEEDYRCATATALEQQSKYEKKLRYDILEQTPNYRARLRESLEKNATAIEFHNERVRRKEEEERLRNEMQDAAEAEKVRKEAEEKEKEAED